MVTANDTTLKKNQTAARRDSLCFSILAAELVVASVGTGAAAALFWRADQNSMILVTMTMMLVTSAMACARMLIRPRD
jgi:hypothetical protein